MKKEMVQVSSVGASPPGFEVKLQILWTSLELKLHQNCHDLSRTAFCAATWSSKMPLADTGAVLSMLDGPKGCDPAFQVSHDSLNILLSGWRKSVG